MRRGIGVTKMAIPCGATPGRPWASSLCPAAPCRHRAHRQHRGRGRAGRRPEFMSHRCSKIARPRDLTITAPGGAMGATSRIVAAVMIGLAVTGCGLTRQAEQRREAAQQAADDARCRSYGFRNDADLARCRMQLDLARLQRSSAGGGHTGGATPNMNSPSLSLLCRDAIARRDSASMLVMC